MTLLEIMIVLAILALVMGLVIGPKVYEHFQEAKRETARMTVQKMALQDFPRWSLSHHDPCPRSLASLTGSADNDDPWGTAYKMYCGSSAPTPEVAFGAASFGHDTIENTRDDIRSWDGVHEGE